MRCHHVMSRRVHQEKDGARADNALVNKSATRVYEKTCLFFEGIDSCKVHSDPSFELDTKIESSSVEVASHQRGTAAAYRRSC